MFRIRMAVLGSGKGSNFRAILAAIQKGGLPAEVVAVASDHPGAGILELASKSGIETLRIHETKFKTRLSPEVESTLAGDLLARRVDLVVLAGYMRVLKAPMLDAFPRRIVNIHPSLLPAFKGLEAWRQAIDAGVTESGCTVHLVDSGVDSGEILGRERVPVLPDDTPATLHARIQEAEHRLFPRVLAEFTGKLTAES